jgi:hypothetical protein
MGTGLMVGVVALAAAALMIWNGLNVSRFERRYRHRGGFGGRSYECALRWSWAEADVRCVAAADAEALYLLAPPPGRERMPPQRAELRIPWGDMELREGSLLMQQVLWFQLPRQRIHFHLSHEVGVLLLADAGRG